MKLFRKEAFGLGIFFLILAIFFAPTLLQGKLPVPTDSLVGLYHPWRDALATEYPRGMPFKNFLITDPIRQQIPWRKIAIDQWKLGKVPKWNAYNFSGTPLSANIQAGVFYPFNVLFFFFDFPIAWTILIMLQPLLGGVFLYIYLRNLNVHTLASVFGAVVWSLGGFSISWLTWGTIGHVALWFPLMLYAVDTSKAGLLTTALVFSFFAGHSQIYLYIVSVCAAYAIWRKKISQKFLLWSVVIFIFISSLQWIPLLKFLPTTSRFDDVLGWQKPGWFLPWQHLVQFLAPDFFGNPTTLNYWGVWNYGEFIGYMGIISLIFLGYALLTGAATWKFWVAVLGTSLVFMLPNFISKLSYQLQIPVISALQPTRLMVVVNFSIAILASLGFHAFLKNPKKSIIRVVLFVGVLLGVLWATVYLLRDPNLAVAKRNLILPSMLFFAGGLLLIAWSRYHRERYIWVASLLVLGIISFDLIRFGWKFTPFTEQKYFFPNTASIEFLQKQQQPFRVMSLDDRIFAPNLLTYYGIESIDGYDPIYSRLYEEFIASSERNTANITPPYGFNRIIAPHNIDSPLIPLLNVRYVVTLGELNRPYLRQIFQEGETRVYEDNRVLPRAFFVDGILIEQDRQAILDRMFDKESNPRITAIVEKPIELLSTPVDTREYISVRKYGHDEVELEAHAQSNRYLVVSNMFYPGWEATINGENTEIYRTNYLMQGLVVPPGTHTIVLRYRG